MLLKKFVHTSAELKRAIALTGRGDLLHTSTIAFIGFKISPRTEAELCSFTVINVHVSPCIQGNTLHK
jgi:hypothetical protein